MADELTLEDILEKVYFEGRTYHEVKEFLFPALRKIKDLNCFFDILFNVIKDYANVIDIFG